MDRHRWNFSLRDVMVAMIALGMLFAIGAHWINVTREQNRKIDCVENLKNLGIAVHCHHDVFLRFPNVAWDSSRPPYPEDRTGPPAGYSWAVRMLPYIDECSTYNNLAMRSARFQFGPFAGPLIAPQNGRPIWSSQIPGFQCPAYSGSRWATATEYAKYGGSDASGLTYGLAISNYVALTATHLENAISGSSKATPPARNGTIVNTRHIKFRNISDGISRTLMICESRESAYSSWYDGAVGWVVAADPNGNQPTFSADGFWSTTGGSSLNAGPSRKSPKAAYLKGGTLSTMGADRKWGPSSEHASGGVNHVMVDGSVHSIMPDIDATLYLQLTTRAGREPVSLP